MKVYLNLAVARNRRERYSLVWSIPTLAVSLLVLAWLGMTVVHDLHREHQVHQSLTQVRAQENIVRAREIHVQQQIQRPEFQRMMRETRFVNRLINERQFSLTDLTFKVSKLLPPSARLNGLALASPLNTNPQVQFAVMGKNAQAIDTFLDNLEDSNDFDNVIIKSQGFRQGTGTGTKGVALVCTARYVAGTSTAKQ